jgi:hypothetical protein
MYGLAATAGVLILTSIAAPAGAAENTAVPGQLGDQWEVASRISMPMAMSALQSRICDLASIPVPAGAGEATAAPGEPGEKWEVTSQMSMEGMQMAMPPRTSTVCAPKEWKEPPAGDEGQNCQTSDFKVVGAKATWKMTCAGPPAMTGEGEITREGPDTYSGAIKFTSEGGNITIKLSGKRLGSCEL